MPGSRSGSRDTAGCRSTRRRPLRGRAALRPGGRAPGRRVQEPADPTSATGSEERRARHVAGRAEAEHASTGSPGPPAPRRVPARRRECREAAAPIAAGRCCSFSPPSPPRWSDRPDQGRLSPDPQCCAAIRAVSRPPAGRSSPRSSSTNESRRRAAPRSASSAISCGASSPSSPSVRRCGDGRAFRPARGGGRRGPHGAARAARPPRDRAPQPLAGGTGSAACSRSARSRVPWRLARRLLWVAASVR